MAREPLKAGEDSRRNWRRINEVDGDLSGVVSALAAAGFDRYRTGADAGRRWGYHPFKLYQVPARFAGEGTDPDRWRRFQVRHGAVLGYNAANTDLELNPDLDTVAIATNEVLVPAGVAAYWFWLWVPGDSQPVVYHGASPEVYDESSNPHPWESFPYPDETHWPIGYVDTLTRLGTKRALVRQLLRGDVVVPAGAGGGSGSANVGLFKVVAHEAERLRTVKLVEGAWSVEETLVYKPWKLRFSSTGATIDGVSIGYSGHDATGQTRLATVGVGGPQYTEVICTRYLEDDLVLASYMRVEDVAGAAQYQWVDLNVDGRAWGRKYS